MIFFSKKNKSRLSENGFDLRGWQCETSVDAITRAWSHLQWTCTKVISLIISLSISLSELSLSWLKIIIMFKIMITWSNLQWTCTKVIRISLIISWSLISQNHYDSESMTLLMPILSLKVMMVSISALDLVIIFEHCNCQELTRSVRRLFKCVVIFDHHNRRLSCWLIRDEENAYIFEMCGNLL